MGPSKTVSPRRSRNNSANESSAKGNANTNSNLTSTPCPIKRPLNPELDVDEEEQGSPSFRLIPNYPEHSLVVDHKKRRLNNDMTILSAAHGEKGGNLRDLVRESMFRTYEGMGLVFDQFDQMKTQHASTHFDQSHTISEQDKKIAELGQKMNDYQRMFLDQSADYTSFKSIVKQQKEEELKMKESIIQRLDEISAQYKRDEDALKEIVTKDEANHQQAFDTMKKDHIARYEAIRDKFTKSMKELVQPPAKDANETQGNSEDKKEHGEK